MERWKSHTIRQDKFSMRAPFGRASRCLVYIFHIWEAMGSSFCVDLLEVELTSPKGKVDASRIAFDLYDGMSRFIDLAKRPVA